MILDRAITKKIEQHLYNHQAEREELAAKENEIASRICAKMDPTGVRSRNNTDITALKVAEIEKETGELGKWVKVVQKTRDTFRGTPQGQLMAMLYTERLHPLKIQSALYISSATFYMWKTEIIYYAALQASAAGLISV